MKRSEALRTAEAALHQAGFQVSYRCTARTSCFDFAARREERLVFVKAFSDIRDVSPSHSAHIKGVSRCFSSACLFISDVKDKEALRDDTVYSRYGVYAVTSKTLEDIVLRGALPLVKASRGGYSVKIHGGKIRNRRHELGLSIGKLAEMVGVSRRSLYGYEKGMTRASVSAAYRLEKILGAPVVKTIDVFEVPVGSLTSVGSFSSDCPKTRNSFIQWVLDKLALLNLRVTFVTKAPFDFAADCPGSESKIIGGVFHNKERCVEERMEEIVSLSRILGAKPLLLGKEKMSTPENVTFVKHDELARMEDGKELTLLL